MGSPIEISVLIPILATKPEHIGWLREAVDSVTGQDYPVKQIIVCDDCSPVPVDALRDCVTYRMKERGGVCEARNFLGHQCVTEYLLFLDGDDKLCEGALAKMAALADPKKAVFGNLMLFGEGFGQRYHSLRNYDGRALLESPIMPIMSLHTKAAFEEIGGFDTAFEGGLEEWDYNIRLMLAGVCGEQIDEPLFWYRRHKDQRSNGRSWLRRQTHKIRDKYRMLEGVDMPCCGGRKRPGNPGPRGNPGSITAQDLASGEMVLIEYTGNRLGSIVLRGRATNTSYRFGASQRQKYVWPQDAPGILELPAYQLIRKQRAVSAPPPDVELLEREVMRVPGKGRPSAHDDLTAIKGLGATRVAKLVEAGVTRFEHLAVVDAEYVAGVTGVSAKQADSWIREAKELA